MIRKFLGSPAHDIRCPGDHTPPTAPHAISPAATVTAREVGTVNVNLVNGAAVSGPTVPLRVDWTPVTDPCLPVTYSVMIETYHCHQVADLVEPATYRNRGWCQWMPFTYQSTTATTFSLNYPLGTHLYNVHLPFAAELGWDLTFTGTRPIVYAPFWLKVRLFANDGNGTSSGSRVHEEARYFVLYRDGTVPLTALSDIPLEP